MLLKKYLFLLTIIIIAQSCSSDFSKGDSFFKEGKYHTAVEMYFSYIREHPKGGKVTHALYNMGDITYRYIGDTTRGLRYFSELVSNYPVDKFTLLAQQNIAEIYKDKLNDCDRAIVEYQKLIDWDPESEGAPYFLYQIGSCYMQIRNYPQALIELEALLKNHPQSKYVGDTLYQMGTVHYINERYEKAIKHYSMVINQYKGAKYLNQAKFGIASCYEEMEEFDTALEQYEKLLDDYPSKKVIQIRIAGLKQRKKKLNR